MKPQHFHAVLKRSRNCVQNVGSGHEENLRQVVFDVEIVVLEHEVLFRIENFEERC